MTISIPEFEAMIDILQETVEASEHLTADEAIDVREAVERVIRKCRDAIAALDMGLVRTLEGATAVRGSTEYSVAPAGKWRWDHDEVAKTVALLASQADEDGLVPTAHRAAAEAARMMKLAYTSASTDAKVGQISSFGMNPDGLRDWVGAEGRKVVSKPVGTAPRSRKPLSSEGEPS